MTPSEMEAEIKNLNDWAREIAQNLPLLATKEDLKVYATKEDLRNEVAKLATKEDLKAFATKEELRGAIEPLATKDFVLNLIKVTRREIRQVDDKLTSMGADVRRIAEHLATLATRKRRKR
jgi:hypothetical protein